MDCGSGTHHCKLRWTPNPGLHYLSYNILNHSPALVINASERGSINLTAARARPFLVGRAKVGECSLHKNFTRSERSDPFSFYDPHLSSLRPLANGEHKSVLTSCVTREGGSRNLFQSALTAALNPLSFFDRSGTFCMGLFYSFVRPRPVLVSSQRILHNSHEHGQILSQTCRRISQVLEQDCPSLPST